MNSEINIIDSFKMDIRRMVRLYPREVLAEKLSEFIIDNFTPNALIELRTASAISPDEIMAVVCDYFETTMMQLRVRNRKKELVYVRQLAMFMLATRSQLSLKTIGEYFGGRDHSTVWHSKHNITDMISKSEKVRDDVQYLNDLLSNNQKAAS